MPASARRQRTPWPSRCGSGYGAAVGLVVRVVELADHRVAGVHHLAVELPRDLVAARPGRSRSRPRTSPRATSRSRRADAPDRPARPAPAAPAGRRGCGRWQIRGCAAWRRACGVSSHLHARGFTRTIRVLVRGAGRDRPHRDGLEPPGLEPARGRGARVVLAHGHRRSAWTSARTAPARCGRSPTTPTAGPGCAPARTSTRSPTAAPTTARWASSARSRRPPACSSPRPAAATRWPSSRSSTRRAHASARRPSPASPSPAGWTSTTCSR